MNSKITSFIFAFVAMSFLVALVSAGSVINIANNAPTNVAHNANEVSFNAIINNTGDEAANVTFSISSLQVGTSYSFSNNVLNLGNTTADSATTQVKIRFPSQQTGPITGTIQANNGVVDSTSTFSINIIPSQSVSISKLREVTSSQNSSINVTNTGNVDLSNINLSVSGNLPITLSQYSISQLYAVSGTPRSQIIDVYADLSSLGSKFGSFSSTITATNSSGSQIGPSNQFTVTKTFCKSGATSESAANLSISQVDISSSGDDNNIWMPLDVITVEVEVENKNYDISMKDVWVEIGLFDSSGNNKIKDLDFEDTTDAQKIEIGTLSKDSKESVTFVFTLPANFNSGSSSSYKLAVKAYSKSTGESKECDDSAEDLEDGEHTYQEITVDRQDDAGKYIAFTNTKTSPDTVTCGDSSTISFDVVNVGDVEQARVKVRVYNKDLKLDRTSEIKTTFDTGDDKSMSFTFTVPTGIADKTYDLELSSEYEYRNNVYKDQSDDVFKVPLKVIGCTPVDTKIASISATLESEATAGKNLEVKTTIRNLGSETATFTVDAENYDSWATLDSTSGNVLTLGAGDSRDVTFVFSVNNDAAGSKSFTIVASSGDNTETRDVSVDITGSSTGLFSGFNLAGNSLIWVIAAINIILVIIIIIVAVRVAQR